MTPNILPLIDLHRHLDGNVRVSTILSLAQQYDLPLPANTQEALEKAVYIQDRTSDLMAFLQKLDYGVSVLASLDACERIAFENVEDAFKEGLAYVELRFSPYYMSLAHKLPLSEVVAAVVQGTARGMRAYKVKAKLIGILSRTYGQDACMEELKALLAHKDAIAGLDLAGDEANFPAAMFVEHFNKAKANTDWQFTIHAGEASDAQSVWDAINLLKATRIGHGVRAIFDESLMQYMTEHRIGIESCVTSNYQTGTWLDIDNHPVKQFLAHGIPVCLNTDDPGVSNIKLADEFKLARERLNLSDSEIDTLKSNAIDISFASNDEKQTLRGLYL
ncbi:adenosine deaminase [Glaciecola siphonariae]|uniref:adenosine deaminase n=1 Tax=Glaciecola siphonariae TaxID=521012 RepID=A0ABV9LTL5_9ALTE